MSTVQQVKGTTHPLCELHPGTSAASKARHRRHNYRDGKRCPDCGALIQNRSTYCKVCYVKHSAPHPRRPCTERTWPDVDYWCNLYAGEIVGSVFYAMAWSTRMCTQFGTAACLTCTDAPPVWCPALDGHPYQQCESCTAPCKCNGRLKAG